MARIFRASSISPRRSSGISSLPPLFTPRCRPIGGSVHRTQDVRASAFCSTVIQDWGTNYLAATTLGDKAFCLVDLGHHAPNVNIELIVARLVAAGRLAGFHFNDSKYGDDDLDAGSIAPYRLFLVFNELVAELRHAKGFNPAHMISTRATT